MAATVHDTDNLDAALCHDVKDCECFGGEAAQVGRNILATTTGERMLHQHIKSCSDAINRCVSCALAEFYQISPDRIEIVFGTRTEVAHP